MGQPPTSGGGSGISDDRIFHLRETLYVIDYLTLSARQPSDAEVDRG